MCVYIHIHISIIYPDCLKSCLVPIMLWLWAWKLIGMVTRLIPNIFPNHHRQRPPFREWRSRRENVRRSIPKYSGISKTGSHELWFNHILLVQCGTPKIAKLVYNSHNYGLWMFMVLITIVIGAYKPTYNWGAPHCKNISGPVCG